MLEKINRIFSEYQPKPLGDQRESGVLLPLIKRKGLWHVIFEVRSHLVSQPGDTSFPGGRREGNESFKETAIRETMEELQIADENIRIIGEMDYVATEKDLIYCYIGLIEGIDFEDIQPNEEVERLFTLPLTYLLAVQPVWYEIESQPHYIGDFPIERLSYGQEYAQIKNVRKVPFYQVPDVNLWGYTANLTSRFIEILKIHDQELNSEGAEK